jgi:hypothetical protein
MLPYPKNRPIFENLNTSYLLVDRLLDHFRSTIGHGVVHMRSPAAEGVLFFNPQGLLNAAVERSGEKVVGPGALEEILRNVREVPHTLSIYSVPAESARFWAEAPLAQAVRTGIESSTENIVGMIEKLGEERLTGYVHIALADARGNAFLLFDGGAIVCGTFDIEGAGEDNEENLQLLIDKVHESGGIFDIYGVGVASEEEKAEARSIAHSQTVKALEGLLNHLEDILGKKYAGRAFSPRTAISRKFLEKADRYPFLDPFSGEVVYTDQKLSCDAEVPAEEILRAVLEVTHDLVAEHSASDLFEVRMKQWKANYAWVLRDTPLGK